jgi:hypothetical protein
VLHGIERIIAPSPGDIHIGSDEIDIAKPRAKGFNNQCVGSRIIDLDEL